MRADVAGGLLLAQTEFGLRRGVVGQPLDQGANRGPVLAGEIASRSLTAESTLIVVSATAESIPLEYRARLECTSDLTALDRNIRFDMDSVCPMPAGK